MPEETEAKSWGHLSVPQLVQDFQGFPRMSFIMITTSRETAALCHIKVNLFNHRSTP